MNLPEGVTEEEFNKVVSTIQYFLAPKYKFAYMDKEDIEQEIYILCLQGLDGYSPERGTLNSFLSIFVRNRLSNLKRKHYHRIDVPCFNCPFKAYNKEEDLCEKYDNKFDCSLYANWKNRNQTKQNIASPISIDCVVGEKEDNMKIFNDIDNSIDAKDIMKKIDNEISIKNRGLWISFKNNVQLKSKQWATLLEEIIEIVGENAENV